ncbi:MAG: type I restriction enzyme HsdR N-terminal domain-containing protein [Prevotella sp.]|nr:type I restriction enzyme HsdR N-terminal domain-containing protein [Prevotella sp.]
MFSINLPEYEIKIREREGKPYIFDDLRRKYVALTPEEWVRQHFIHYLTDHKHYPKGLLVNETELRLGEKHMRCDSVLYDKEMHPRMIIEYKAPTIALTQRTFDQISAYNHLLHVDYLVLSNGIQHICCRMDYDNQSYMFLKEVPDYGDLYINKV